MSVALTVAMVCAVAPWFRVTDAVLADITGASFVPAIFTVTLEVVPS